MADGRITESGTYRDLVSVSDVVVLQTLTLTHQTIDQQV